MKWAMSACALAAVLVVASVIAAQEPDKDSKPAVKAGEKWEYCEIVTSITTTTRAKAAMPGGGAPGGAGGGPGGGAGGPGGLPGAAPGGGGFAAAVRTTKGTVTITTGDDETPAKNWEELATKLKLPAPKKELTESAHRMRVLNHLGSQGWELVSSQQGSSGSTSAAAAATGANTSAWTFKRKVK